MKKSIHLKTFLAFIVIGLFVIATGCIKQRVNTPSDQDQQQTPSGGDSTTPPPSNGSNGETGGEYGYNHPACRTGSPPGIADGNQILDYYKADVLPRVIAHGTSQPYQYASSHPGGVVWSSETDLPASLSPNIFFTNSRFNLRVKALEGVRSVDDAKGNYCRFVPMPYQKLRIGVVVRKAGSSGGHYYRFEDVKVGEFSNVKEFVVPPGTNEPLIIEFRDLEWDYDCKNMTETNDPNAPFYCPYSKIWHSQCVSLRFEFATDETRDIPCPRAY